jgi:hypothetical protein
MRNAVLVSLVVLVAIEAMAAGPKFTTSWRAPEASGVRFFGQKVAALVVTSDEPLRVSGEEQLARELTSRGMEGTPTYRIAPKEELGTAERAKPWFERAGINGVVALRPVSRERQVKYTPTVWTTSMYSTLWGYYGYSWTAVYDPGAARTDTTLVIETLVYSVPLDKLLWGGVSTTTNPKEAPVFINQLVTAAVEEMKKRGLVE